MHKCTAGQFHSVTCDFTYGTRLEKKNEALSEFRIKGLKFVVATVVIISMFFYENAVFHYDVFGKSLSNISFNTKLIKQSTGTSNENITNGKLNQRL